MPRDTLDHKIRQLMDQILILDSMVEIALTESVEALKKQDTKAAKRIYNNDERINAKRFELENDCVITIATQQPIMAGDLRLMASILEVVGELERMGDYAKGIAHICMLIGDQAHIKPLIDIPRMLSISVEMLHDAISAFVSHDAETARKIPVKDDEVDALYNQVYRELVAIMLSDPSTIDQANYLMWVAHNLERVADRVTNICERTIYVVTGNMSEINQEDEDFLAPQ